MMEARNDIVKKGGFEGVNVYFKPNTVKKIIMLLVNAKL